MLPPETVLDFERNGHTVTRGLISPEDITEGMIDLGSSLQGGEMEAMNDLELPKGFTPGITRHH